MDRMAALMNDHEAVLTAGFSVAAWAHRWMTRELDFTTAPLLLAFLPFLFLAGKRGFIFQYLITLTVLCFLGLAMVSYQPRLLFPALAVFVLLAGVTLGGLKDQRWTVLWAVAVGVFGWFSLLSLGRLTVNYFNADQVWMGKQTRAEYLASPAPMASYIALTQAAGALLPPSDRLLVVGDSRSLYYPRPFLANSVFDPQVLEVLARRAKDAEGIWRGLREMGVDDLVVSGEEGMRVAEQYGHYALKPGEWEKLDGFIQSHADLVFRRGASGVYHLRDQPVQRKKPIPNLLNLLRK